jgi:hypothetical protein
MSLPTSPDTVWASSTSQFLMLGPGELTLASRHHDLRARVPNDRAILATTAKLYAREQCENPDEYTELDRLAFTYDLLHRTWPWADFVRGPRTPDSQRDQRVYFTTKVADPPETAPPRPMAGRGDAITCKLEQGEPLMSCGGASFRRNKRGELDRMRRSIAEGGEGYLVDRR